MGVLKKIFQRVAAFLSSSRLQKVWALSPELIVGTSAIFTVFVVVFRGIAARFDHDEFEAVHSAWLILDGNAPYVDFFQHHHPLLYYVLAPVLAITGESADAMITCRVFIAVVWGVTLLLTAMLARRLFDNLTALLSFLLLASWGVVAKWGMQIRPDVPYVCMMMAALVLLFPKSGRPGRVALVSAGVCCAVSFLFHQKAVFFVTALVLCMVFRVVRGRLTVKDFLLWAAGGIVGVLPYYTLLIATGAFEQYFFVNWTINAHWLREIDGKLSSIMSISPTHYVMGFVGVALCIRHEERAQIGFIALANVTLIYIARVTLPQYILGACPLLAVLGGYAFVNLTRRQIPALAVGAWLMVYLLPGRFQEGFDSKIRDEQLAVIQDVLDVTQKDDIVHDGNIQFNLFRRDLGYFWFSLSSKSGLDSYRSLRPYKYDVLKLIKKKRPAIVSNIRVNEKQLKKQYVKFREVPGMRRPQLIFIRKDLAPDAAASETQ